MNVSMLGRRVLALGHSLKGLSLEIKMFSSLNLQVKEIFQPLGTY